MVVERWDMIEGEASRRLSVPAAVVGAVSMALALGIMLADALAHHPGSHAARRPDGRVALDLAANVTDGCTTVAAVKRGTPPAAQAPAGADPVVVQLQRPAEAICTQVVRTVRSEAMLDTPSGVGALHLFTLAPDGRVVATERVPIRERRP